MDTYYVTYLNAKDETKHWITLATSAEEAARLCLYNAPWAMEIIKIEKKVNNPSRI